MAYDEQLAERIESVLSPRADLSQRKMFGGIAFMLAGNMCCGVVNDDLMVRLAPEDAERALAEDYVRPMDFTGRPMKGFIFVSGHGLVDDNDLESWVEAGADFASTLPAKER